MSVTRREFLKTAVAGATATTMSLPLTRMAEAAVQQLEKGWQWDKSVCRFCGTGCGILVATQVFALLQACFMALLTFTGSLLVFLLCEPLMSLFTEESRVVEIGAVYLRIDALVFYAYIILSVCVSALQGMKRPLYAVLIGLWRQIVAPALLFWVLTEAMGLGLLGIWWGIFAITWSAALFTLFYARRILRKVQNSQSPIGSTKRYPL